MGFIHSGQEDLKAEAVKYLKKKIKAQDPSLTCDQVKVVSLFSRFVIENEAEALYCPILLGELKMVLSFFKHDKSPRPDGWTIELFIHYFDLVKEDLLEMVEEVRIKCIISDALNSTFLALIPKVNKTQNFGDYRPISLCNLCYKIITKIIENRLKSLFSRSLLEEKLGFLKGCRIQDVIGTVHECFHSIKRKNLKYMVLKLDLQKAYDYIN